MGRILGAPLHRVPRHPVTTRPERGVADLRTIVSSSATGRRLHRAPARPGCLGLFGVAAARWTVHRMMPGDREAAGAETLRLVELLLDAGHSWRGIAQAAGVTTASLRRWLAGVEDPPGRLPGLAELAALHTTLSEVFGIQDPSSWLEAPVVPDSGVTGIDLLSAGRKDLLLRLASEDDDPGAILDSFDPRWRDRVEAPYETCVAPDGLPAIRLKPERRTAARISRAGRLHGRSPRSRRESA